MCEHNTEHLTRLFSEDTSDPRQHVRAQSSKRKWNSCWNGKNGAEILEIEKNKSPEREETQMGAPKPSY